MRRIALPTVIALAALAALSAAPAAGARTIHVEKGQSIQAAVDAADPGDKVLVEPGKYTERSTKCPFEADHSCAVVVTDDDISLVAKSGKKPVVLKAKGDQDDGIGVGTTLDPACLTNKSKRVEGSLIKGFTVKGFADDGVFLACVGDWRITKVRAVNDFEYGIFPSHSVDGRVDHSFASGANDTGVYVGQSSDVRMDHNTAQDNVSGFEIENSSDVTADHNTAEGNTAGILSFALPGLDVKSNSGNTIEQNTVTANNRPNTCVEPGDTVCKVPPGTGILLLAADTNEVKGNTVTANNSLGIAVSNYCIGTQASAEECAAIDIDPDPNGNHVISNTATGNGSAPSLPPGFEFFAVDLAWDTSGDGNCWSGNTAGTTFPDPLPAC